LDYAVINFNALYSPSITVDSGSSRDPLSAAYRAQLSLVPSFAGLPPAVSPRCQMRCYDWLHLPLPQYPQTGVPFTATLPLSGSASGSLNT